MLGNVAISSIYFSAFQGKKLGRTLRGYYSYSKCLLQPAGDRQPGLNPPQDDTATIPILQMAKRRLGSRRDLLQPHGQEERS